MEKLGTLGSVLAIGIVSVGALGERIVAESSDQNTLMEQRAVIQEGFVAVNSVNGMLKAAEGKVNDLHDNSIPQDKIEVLRKRLDTCLETIDLPHCSSGQIPRLQEITNKNGLSLDKPLASDEMACVQNISDGKQECANKISILLNKRFIIDL